MYHNPEPNPKQTRRKYEASSKEGTEILAIVLNTPVVSRIKLWQGIAFYIFEGKKGEKKIC